MKLLKNPRLWLMLGSISNAALGFLSIGLLARKLSTDEFGSWVIFITIMGFFEMFRAGFVYQALVKFVASTPQKHKQQTYINAAWKISFGLTLALLMVLCIMYFFFYQYSQKYHFELFIIKYPVVICLMLPINMATWIFHAKQQFGLMWLLNFLLIFPFLGLLFFLQNPTVQQVANYYIYIRLGVAVVSILLLPIPLKASKSFFMSFFRQSKSQTLAMYEMWQFSKFTVVSTLGTNLLKSADVWIINLFAGPMMVAFYNVPLKLIEVVEIPLRSWAMSAFPKFSALAHTDLHTFKTKFVRDISFFTLIMLPFLGIIFHFSEEIIRFFAGDSFILTTPILKIFTIYLLFLPLDRFIGIALDSLNLPKINTLKVFLMVFLNIVGDYLVLKNQYDLRFVAVVTLINISVGIVVGLFFLTKKINNSDEHFSFKPTIWSR